MKLEELKPENKIVAMRKVRKSYPDVHPFMAIGIHNLDFSSSGLIINDRRRR